MNEQQLAEIYEMVDSISFSRPKKNISRDFSDGVMLAELIHHYQPKKVQLHNYPSTNTISKKIENWNTLNNKVLKKFAIQLTPNQIQEIVQVKPMAIQKVLHKILLKFQRPSQQNVKLSNKFINNYGETEKNLDNQPNSGSRLKRLGIGHQLSSKQGNMINVKRQHEDTEQILDLIDKIDYQYARLIKMQEMGRLKDDIIKNLQKKVEKIIFN